MIEFKGVHYPKSVILYAVFLPSCVVAQLGPEASLPLSPLVSGYASDFGSAECVEVIDE